MPSCRPKSQRTLRLWLAAERSGGEAAGSMTGPPSRGARLFARVDRPPQRIPSPSETVDGAAWWGVIVRPAAQRHSPATFGSSSASRGSADAVDAATRDPRAGLRALRGRRTAAPPRVAARQAMRTSSLPRATTSPRRSWRPPAPRGPPCRIRTSLAWRSLSRPANGASSSLRSASRRWDRGTPCESRCLTNG